MPNLQEQIQRLLDPILVSLGLTLWDMELRKHGPQWLLRIYIDREAGGVTLADCEAVSRDLGTVLDVEEIVPHSYTLEVSSPGLDRSLTRPEHYRRCRGSLVRSLRGSWPASRIWWLSLSRKTAKRCGYRWTIYPRRRWKWSCNG